MPNKILVLELLTKMFLTNEISGFFSLKKLRAQVDFLFVDKDQSFLQVGAIAFGGHGQPCPKYPT